MNITMLFFSTVMKQAVNMNELRNPQSPIINEVVISHPLLKVKVPGCPFCQLERCQPLDFCYIIKNSVNEFTSHEFCGSSQDLSSIVRDPLANHLTDNACQPAVSDLNTAYCWCQNSSSRDTVEDQLRRVRLWRYQNLKWHADREYNSGYSDLTKVVSILCSVLLLTMF